ncbi:MAG: hypothetical protein C0506_11770 [Anaerolinea sp.]|nr:hypothetical protein [Anaerolinea sp.]
MTQVMRVQEPLEKTISRLETFLARMERRYECSTEKAAEAVDRGQLKPTAEIGKWLASYRTLLHLKDLAGQEDPSTISDTR